MRKFLLLAALLIPSFASAQNSFFYRVWPPAPDAFIRICPMTAIGPTTNPCTNPAPIWADMAQTVPARNPVGLGPDGAYAFWISPGQYFIQYQGASLRTEIFEFGGSGGGGTGCVLPVGGVDTGVLSEHPKGTCFDSIKFTWDATAQNMLAGDGLSTAAASTNIFSYGNSNTMVGNKIFSASHNSTVKGTEIVNLGNTNTLNSSGVGTLGPARLLSTGTTITLSSNALATDLDIIGSSDTLIAGNAVSGINQFNCLHGIGGNNTFTIDGGLASASSIQETEWLGKDNNIHVTAFASQIDHLSVVGHLNHATSVGGGVSFAGIFGNQNTLSDCSDCYAIGENISQNVSHVINMGFSGTPEVTIKQRQFRLSPLPFSSLPACSSSNEGSMMPVTDSATNTWGATITGGAGFHVLAYCDGTNWTVAAK